jgi:hypothetical protein
MGTQQRNRHPANRLGKRRRSNRMENRPQPASESTGNRGGPSQDLPGVEPWTRQRPEAQDSPPHQGHQTGEG